jgi:glucosamine--fructose-6-phosphate aminotransferase (isomerizing)
MHGSQTLAGEDFPLLVFTQHDEAFQGIADVVALLADRGVPIITAGPAPAGGSMALPSGPELGPFATPIALIQSFYPVVDAIARARDRDPDAPPHLLKVTETI